MGYHKDDGFFDYDDGPTSSFENYEIQVQDASGNWFTAKTVQYVGDRSLDNDIDTVQKMFMGRRIRVLNEEGRIADMRN